MTCLSDALPKGSPVLDASVVINILGTGAAADVLAGLGHPSLVEERTLREVLRHPLTDTDLPQALKHLQGRGHLKVVRMTDQEYGTYLGLVSGSLGSRLGVGESAAISIAARGQCLVLDDRKARRRSCSLTPQPAIASSLQLILASAARQGWSASRARELVSSARLHARMAVIGEEMLLLDGLLKEA